MSTTKLKEEIVNQLHEQLVTQIVNLFFWVVKCSILLITFGLIKLFF